MRVTALVNRDELHEGRLGRLGTRGMAGKENHALAGGGPALKAMARSPGLILLVSRSHWGT